VNLFLRDPLAWSDPRFLIINLLTDPREENPTVDTWAVNPMLKIVGAFDATTKDHPLIQRGTPDLYTPPKQNDETSISPCRRARARVALTFLFPK
jgi:hypothetical protein